MNRDDLRAKAEAARDAIAAHAALNEDEPAERRAYARMEEAVEAMREALTPDVVLALLGVTTDGTVDPAALRARALAATPGRWHIYGGHNDYAIYSAQAGDRVVPVLNLDVYGIKPERAAQANADAEYIVAIDPTTLLALLSERDALVAEIATTCNCRFIDGQGEVPCESHAAVQAERDALAARVAGLQKVLREARPLVNFALSTHHDYHGQEAEADHALSVLERIDAALAALAPAPPAPEYPPLEKCGLDLVREQRESRMAPPAPEGP